MMDGRTMESGMALVALPALVAGLAALLASRRACRRSTRACSAKALVKV